MLEQQIYYAAWGILPLTLLTTGIVVVPIFVQMALYSCACIHIGSHLSLLGVYYDQKTGQAMTRHDKIDSQEALFFPVFASGALVTLYMAYRFLPLDWVNFLAALYICGAGVVAVGQTIVDLTDDVIEESHKLRTPIIDRTITIDLYIYKQEVKVSLSVWELCAFSASGLLMFTWFFTKSWQLHNLCAFAFCIQVIRRLTIGNFKVGYLMLLALFFYDIFWVFGTDVMETVAKSFDGPAKILMPRSLDPFETAMLGLGDVVLPGIFVALALRFDRSRAQMEVLAERTDKKTDEVVALGEGKHAKFLKYHYWTVLGGYAIGLAVTCVVMQYFKRAQPALLYLVPMCLGCLPAVCSKLGTTQDALNYNEEDEVPSAVPSK